VVELDTIDGSKLGDDLTYHLTSKKFRQIQMFSQFLPHFFANKGYFSAKKRKHSAMLGVMLGDVLGVC
jgi:hypothetical protein